jgi:hypothetical protein
VQHYVTVRNVTFSPEDAMSKRLNLTLPDAYTAVLEHMAAKSHIEPGSLARALLCARLDEIIARDVFDILDLVPGAYDQVRRGEEELDAGRGIPLDQF